MPWLAAGWLAGLAAALADWRAETALSALAVLLAACLRLALRRAWPAALICVAAFGLAAGYGHVHQAGNRSALPVQGDIVLQGVLAGQPAIDGDRVRFVLRTDGGERVAVTVRLAAETERAVAGRWRRGDAARLAGELALPNGPRNFGQFDYAAHLAKRGIHRVLNVEGAAHAHVHRPAGFRPEIVLGAVEAYRHKLGARIADLYPGLQAGFMQGMLIGLDDGIDGELYNAFARLGLTHIIAISGLHVAVVTGGWFLLLRLFRVSRETALATAWFVIPLYVLLAGAAPSVVRAGAMALLGVLAVQRGWLKDAMRLAALTAVGMTAWHPAYLHDIGFQLSFLVMAGLVAGTPVALRLLPAGWPKGLAGAVAVTATAQFVSFPLTIHYFNHYSLLSGLANFVLVPVFSLVVLPAGYLSLVASAVSMKAAHWLAAVPGWLNALGFRLIELGSGIDRAGTVWPSPPLPAILLYFGLLAGLAAGIRRWRNEERDLYPAAARLGRRLALACAIGLLAWCAFAYRCGEWDQRGTVAFLDVGQGDAILIRTPEGRNVLVDGGGTIHFHRRGEEWRVRRDPYEVGKDLLVPLLKKRGVRQIDLMIASHGDADHVGGLAAVVRELPTRRIAFNGTVAQSDALRRLLAAALERNIPLHAAGTGQTLLIDRHTRLDFLYPVPADGLSEEKNQNASSVVFLLTMHGQRLLFTGDMDAAAERETIRLLREAGWTFAGDAPLDVMKIAHHGSNTSTSEMWLNRWKPRLAVISVGVRNPYGHPGKRVTERLARRQIPVLRTDLHGEIQLKIRPGEMKWRTFLAAGDARH